MCVCVRASQQKGEEGEVVEDRDSGVFINSDRSPL